MPQFLLHYDEGLYIGATSWK